MNFETIINITCTIISLIAICQWVITGIYKLVKYFRDLKHLKQALQISSKSCCISLSVFEKRITGNVHDYITLYAVKSYQLLETILEKNEISIQPMSTSYEGNNDKIYIGGPAANVEVNSLLTRFKEFKYYTESHQESTYDKNEIIIKSRNGVILNDINEGNFIKDNNGEYILIDTGQPFIQFAFLQFKHLSASSIACSTVYPRATSSKFLFLTSAG